MTKKLTIEDKIASILAWIDEMPESAQLYADWADDGRDYCHIAFTDRVAELKLLAEDYKRVKNES